MSFQSAAMNAALKRVSDQLATLAPEKRAGLEKVMASFTHEELSAFQRAQSRLHAMGKIPLAIAQDVYGAIGESTTKFHSLSLAEQVVVSQVGGELVTMAVKEGISVSV